MVIDTCHIMGRFLGIDNPPHTGKFSEDAFHIVRSFLRIETCHLVRRFLGIETCHLVGRFLPSPNQTSSAYMKTPHV